MLVKIDRIQKDNLIILIHSHGVSYHQHSHRGFLR